MAGLNTVLNNISTVSVNGSLYTLASDAVISDNCSISLSDSIEKRILETSINNVIDKNSELIKALDNILLNRAEELLDNPDSLDDLLLRSRENIDELLSTVQILESRLTDLESRLTDLVSRLTKLESDYETKYISREEFFSYLEYRLQNIENSVDLT